jgi:hypothetical protein
VVLEIDIDDDAALGFAPRRMLELASGPYTEPLHWRSDPELVFGPEQGVGSVTFEVTPTDTPPRLMTSEPKEDAPDADCLDDWIEIDVLLSVQSAGGALNENVPVKLTARDGNVVRFSAKLDHEMLGGTFTLEESSYEGGTLLDLPLAGVFSQYGASGTFGAHYKTSSGRTAAESMGTVASWPAPAEELCDRGFTPTIARDGGEASIQRGLDLLAAASGLVLRGPNDEIVSVELGAMDDGGPACLAPGNGVHPSGSAVTEVVLTVTTEDGAIEHDLVGSLSVLAAADGSLGEVTLFASCNAYPTVEFPGKCGDWGVDVTGYDGVTVAAEISVTPAADAPEIVGTFTISGVPVCPEGDTCDDDPVDIAVIPIERE